MITILAFILVIGVLVLAHELGHFVAAKLFGVKVEEAAFGMFFPIFKKKHKDTNYVINLLPIGGYVKLLGEEEDLDPVDPKYQEKRKKALADKQNLASKKPWQRVVIFGAGVVMNIILAWVLLTGFYLFGGKSLIAGMWEHKGVTNSQKVVITDVVKDSPAAKNGLKKGDVILSIAGKPVYMTDAAFAQVQNSVAKDKNAPINVVILENGQKVSKKLLTYEETVKQGNKEAKIQRVGITMQTQGKIQAKWCAAPVVAASEEWRIIKVTAGGLWDLLVSVFHGKNVGNSVGGPIAIAQISGVAAEMGADALIQLIAVLSVTLAIINILPFPALDGGHIFFILFEAAIGRELSVKAKQTVNMIGFSLLLFLIALVTLNDLMRLDVFGQIIGVFKK